MPRISLPEGDAISDGIALILAILRDDEDGQHAILNNCDLHSVAKVLAAIAAAVTAAAVGGHDIELEQPGARLTPEQIQAAELLLSVAIERPGDDLDPD